jgi:hypothetical protein
MRTRLKILFRLYSPLIGSYNINTGSETTNTILISFMTYSRLRSMINLLLRIITNVVLGLLLSLRFTTMRRKQVLLRIQLQRIMIGLLDAAAIARKQKAIKVDKNDGASSKGNNVQCKVCRAFKHTTEKCRTPKHLVALYQKSLRKDKRVQGSGAGYEPHISILMNSTFEASCSSKDP